MKRYSLITENNKQINQSIIIAKSMALATGLGVVVGYISFHEYLVNTPTVIKIPIINLGILWLFGSIYITNQQKQKTKELIQSRGRL